MENKRVTHTARLILRVWNCGLFAFIWLYFYNAFMFDTYRIQGGIFSILCFIVFYTILCDVYKAFRIASTAIGEIVFSQFLSFSISDFILYVECCLVYNDVVSIIPGLLTVFAQILGTIVIVILAKHYFMDHVEPQTTLLLYGGRATRKTARAFEDRLMFKYRHLFRIRYREPEGIADTRLQRRLNGCETVIMYDVDPDRRATVEALCLENRKNMYFTPNIEDVLDLGCETKQLLDTPLMKYKYRYEDRGRAFVKRLTDIVLSLFFLAIFSPFMLAVAIAIKAEDGGPVFYRQARYTRGGRTFNILKFRSMIVDAEKMGVIPSTEHDPRITKVGRIIRATRLDESPQFLNILRGDMSFVGPRPERVEHVRLYTEQLPEFSYRMRVKGGLTGYAQVFGKYNTSAYDKLLLDLMYIEKQSLLLDIKLILLTIRTIFQKESTEGFDSGKSSQMQKTARREM